MFKDKKENFYAAFIGLFSAIILCMFILPYNLGFAPDSMVYLEVSENVIKGLGFTSDSGTVVKHYPPLFPLGIAVISYVSEVDPQNAGIILQPLLLGLCIFLFYKILMRIDVSKKIALISTLLLVVSQVVTNFLFLLSEGMFLVFLLATIYFLTCWDKSRNREYLILAGLFAALLFLTRYAAIGFIGGFLLFILIRSSKNTRLKDLVWFLSVLTIVVLPWFIYLVFSAEISSGREPGIYIISISKLFSALKTIGFWFFGSIAARICTGLLISISLFYILKQKRDIVDIVKGFYTKHTGYLSLSILAGGSYFIFLIISISFYDPWTPLDNRILSPVFPFVLIFIALLLQELKLRDQKRLLILTSVSLIISFSSSTIPMYARHYQEGSGYTRKIWKESETLNYLKQQSSAKKIYTNGIEIARLHANRKLKLLPFKNDLEGRDKMIAELKSGDAEVLIFYEVNWRDYLIPDSQILEEIRNPDVKKFNDGSSISISE